MDELVTYLRQEIDRLQLLLTAERNQNARLLAAVAHLKEAAGRGHQMVRAAFMEASENSGYIASEALDEAGDAVAKLVQKADDLILPVAVSA